MHTNISVNFGYQVDQNISASVIDMRIQKPNLDFRLFECLLESLLECSKI